MLSTPHNMLSTPPTAEPTFEGMMTFCRSETYTQAFEDGGWDDPLFLFTRQRSQLEEMCESCGMKKGHAIKFLHLFGEYKAKHEQHFFALTGPPAAAVAMPACTPTPDLTANGGPSSSMALQRIADEARVPPAGTLLEVEVAEPGTGEVSWKPAKVLDVEGCQLLGDFCVMINGEQDFVEWYTMQDEGAEWRRVPPDALKRVGAALRAAKAAEAASRKAGTKRKADAMVVASGAKQAAADEFISAEGQAERQAEAAEAPWQQAARVSETGRLVLSLGAGAGAGAAEVAAAMDLVGDDLRVVGATVWLTRDPTLAAEWGRDEWPLADLCVKVTAVRRADSGVSTFDALPIAPGTHPLSRCPLTHIEKVEMSARELRTAVYAKQSAIRDLYRQQTAEGRRECDDSEEAEERRRMRREREKHRLERSAGSSGAGSSAGSHALVAYRGGARMSNADLPEDLRDWPEAVDVWTAATEMKRVHAAQDRWTHGWRLRIVLRHSGGGNNDMYIRAPDMSPEALANKHSTNCVRSFVDLAKKLRARRAAAKLVETTVYIAAEGCVKLALSVLSRYAPQDGLSDAKMGNRSGRQPPARLATQPAPLAALPAPWSAAAAASAPLPALSAPEVEADEEDDEMELAEADDSSCDEELPLNSTAPMAAPPPPTAAAAACEAGLTADAETVAMDAVGAAMHAVEGEAGMAEHAAEVADAEVAVDVEAEDAEVDDAEMEVAEHAEAMDTAAVLAGVAPVPAPPPAIAAATAAIADADADADADANAGGHSVFDLNDDD